MKDRIPEHSATWRARWEKMTGSLNAADEGQIEWDRDLNGAQPLFAVIGGILVAGIALIQSNIEHHWFLTAADRSRGDRRSSCSARRAQLKRVDLAHRQRTSKWEAFARWTDDFPRLKDDPPATLTLWKKILIYGVAFGTADRMIKSGRIPEPVTTSSERDLGRLLVRRRIRQRRLQRNSFSSGFSSQVAPESTSGGGGGFCGGGGGGFGGGGGGGW